MKKLAKKNLIKICLTVCLCAAVCGAVLTNGPAISDSLFTNAESSRLSVSPLDSAPSLPAAVESQPEYLSTLTDLGGIKDGANGYAAGYAWEYSGISAGKFHMLFLDKDGFVFSRGSNEYQQLGLAAGSGARGTNAAAAYYAVGNYYTYFQPVIALNHMKITKVAAGGYHSLAIGHDCNISSPAAADWKIFAWGRQDSGQLGNGSTSATPSGVPTALSFSFPSGEYPVDVSAGEFHSLILTNNKNVYAWGGNTDGQVGNNTVTNRTTPVQISISNVTAISAGGTHSMALNTSKKLYTWGSNKYYQCGSTAASPIKVPTATHTGNTFDEISAGELHSAARLSTTVYTWGSNVGGRLGRSLSFSNDLTLASNKVATIGTANGTYNQVSAGVSTLAKGTDGYLYVAGYGGFDLGLSASGNIMANRFEKTPLKTNFISNGGSHMLILNESNQPFVYGYDARYDEHWYGRTLIQVSGAKWSDGSQMYNTSLPVQARLITTATADAKKRLTPPANIIGLPTNYNRDTPASSSITNKIIVYNSRVKLNYFYSNFTDFKVAQITKANYDSGSVTGAAWKTINRKGAIINRKGYYVVQYRETTGTTVNKFFSIQNVADTEIIYKSTNANTCIAYLDIFDGVGISSLRVNGTGKKWNPNSSSYSTFTYDTGTSTYGAGTHNVSFAVAANSNSTFTLTVKDQANYSTTYQVTIDTVVNAATKAISVTYDGTAKPVALRFHTPKLGEMDLAAFNSRYNGNSYTVTSPTYTGLGTTAPKTAGTYTAAYSIKSGSTSILDDSVTVTIAKRAITINANNLSMTYGDTQPTLTHTIATGSLASGDSITGALTRTAGTNVGSYTISQGTLSISNIGSYTLTFNNGTLTISKRTLSIQANNISRQYGDADPALTYSVVAGSKAASDSYSGALTRAAGSNVGSYAISAGTFTVSNVANYTYSFANGTFTISKRAVTITADTLSKVYGAADPTLTYKVTSGSVVSGDTYSGALSRAGGENVGDYAISVNTLTLGNNYAITYVAGKLTISPKTLTVTAENKAVTYGEDAPAYTVKHTGLVGSDSFTSTATCSYVRNNNAGSYTITVTPRTYANYTPQYVAGTLTVNKKAVTIKADNKTISYLQDVPALTITYTGLISGDTLSDTVSTTYKKNDNAGTYPITVAAKTYTNYTPTYQAGQLTVDKLSSVITASAYQPSEYNGSTINTAAQLNHSQATMSFSPQRGYKDVGIYSITINVPASTNYGAAATTITLEITRRTLTVNAKEVSKEYGDSDPEFTYTYTGLISGDTLSGKLTRSSGEAVGDYAINRGALSAGANYDLIFNANYLHITKKVLTITADVKSKTYGNPDPVFSYTAKNSSGTTISVTLSGTLTRQTGENVGTYDILQGTVTNANNTNYSITYVSKKLTIDKRALGVTAVAASKTYGAADPAFTYNITSGSLLGTDALTGSLSRQAGTDAGTYGITIGTLNNANYLITLTSANFVIKKKDITIKANNASVVYGDALPAFTASYTGLVGTDTLTDTVTTTYARYGDIGSFALKVTPKNYTNYTATYTDGTLTVTKRNLTVTAVNKSAVYGDVPPAYTVTFTGTVNNDALTAVATCPYVQYNNAASYTITVTPKTFTNYNPTFVTGTLTVSKKALTIKANNASITYGDALPAFSVTYTGLVGGDSLTDTVTTAYVRYADAGSYALKVTPKSYTNYNPTYVDGTLSVAKKALTVTADNKSVTYGDAPPAYTVSFSGIVNNDALTAVATSVYARYNNVGAYAITVTPKTFTNYEPAFNSGTLSVTKKSVTIKADNKSVIYGDAPPAYTISYVGLVNGDTLTDTASSAYKRYDNAAGYTITVAPKSYDNYSAVYQTGTLTVNKKAVVITAQNKSITYGDALPAFTFTYTGLINGDTLTDTATTTYVRYGNVGTYSITIVSRTYTNYSPTYNSGSLTVGKKALTINVDNMTIEYGAAVPEFTFSYVGLVNGDELGDSAYTDYTQFSPGGTYYIRISNNTYTNYNVTLTEGVLTVTKATAWVGGDEVQTHTYDGTMKLLSATLSHSEGVLSYSPAQGYIQAGTYEITVSSPATTNYTAVQKVFTLTIKQRELLIVADSKEKIYGDGDPAFTYTYENLLAGDSFTGQLIRESGEDVGVYAIQAGTISAGSNYVTVVSPSNLTIKHRPLTVTAHAKTKVYGDDDPALTYALTSGNLVWGDVLTGGLSRAAGIYVGKYALNIGTLGNSNYVITFVGEYLTITKRPITIKANDMTKVYGDDEPELSYSIISGSLAFFDTISAAVARTPGEDVGVYPIDIVQSENNSYDITYEGNSFTITTRPIKVSANAQTKVYGYADPELTYAVTEGSLAFDDTLTGVLLRDVGEDKGVYEIRRGGLTNANNTNYDISYVGNSLTIVARPLTLAAVDKNKIYGDGDPALEYIFAEGTPAFSDTIAGAISRIAGEDVGEYTIHSGTISNDNNDNYDITFNDGTFTVIRRNITVKARHFEKTYGYNEPPLPYDISEGELAFSDKLNGLLARPAEENIGTYTITQGTLNNANNGNYNITFISDTFVIVKRSVTVTANTLYKSYGDADPQLTYSITTGSLGFADRLSGVLERAPGENLGSYSITQGALDNANNPNYDITFNEGSLIIRLRGITVTAVSTSKIYGEDDPALTYEITSGSTAFDETLVGEVVRVAGEGVGNYSITAGTLTNENNTNYSIVFVQGAFTVERRPITVTPDELSKTYGYEEPQLTYSITAGNLVLGDTLQGALSREPGMNVGSYAITLGTLSNSNYRLTLTPADFRIIQRLIVIIADRKEKIYGESDPYFSYGFLGGSLLAGDSLSGMLGRAEGEDTGAYPIEIGSLNNSNYEIIITSGDLVIKPRPITISANPQSFLHGSASVIELSYQISGDPVPQDEELIASAISVSSSARPDSYVGNYPIYIHQVKPLNNYTVTTVNSLLRILKGEIIDVFFEDLKVLYDGYEQAVVATGDVAKYSVEYKNNIGTEVGVYRATAIFTKENYNDLVLNAKLIIMTNVITTSEIVPHGIIKIETGIDPYVVPVISQNEDAEIVRQANDAITVDEASGEKLQTILNINLYNNGAAIGLDGTAEIRMLLPTNIGDADTLRIVYVGEGITYDVPYSVDGEYIVFTAQSLGNYAFITESHEVTAADKIKGVLFYVGMIVLALILVGFVLAGFNLKRRKRKPGRYV